MLCYLRVESDDAGDLLGLQRGSQGVSHQHGDVILVTHLVTVELCEPVAQAEGQVSLPIVWGRLA